MKKLYVLILLMFSIPLTAADLEPDAGQRHENKLERLSKKLGLTDDQKFKIKGLLKANKEKIQALKETDPEQLKAALSPEQKNKLEQLRKDPETLRKLKNEVEDKKLKID